MLIGVLTLALHLHNAQSLKDKRAVVNALLDRTRARFNVSACQLDNHDLWQRAEIGVAVISNDGAAANRVLNLVRDSIEEWAQSSASCDVVNCTVEII